jgi:hypothetical protein
MVQFWAVSWVEPAFREIFREKWHFFSRSEMRRKMALCCSRKMAKNGTFFRGAKCDENCALLLAKNGENGAFQKKFERKKLAKNGTFETKNRLSPSDDRGVDGVVERWKAWLVTLRAQAYSRMNLEFD